MKRQELSSISGIRFIAIFHIFLHHMWAVYTFHSGKSEETVGLLRSFESAPDWLMVVLSNGWVSTSFFFMLSGFLIGYLYWKEKGGLSVKNKIFWIARAARIFPVHLLVLTLLVFIKISDHLASGLGDWVILGSVVTNIFLLQAWIPAHIPLWNWPSWTISVLLFLYLVTPIIVAKLSKLSLGLQRLILFILPMVSLIPAVGYWQTTKDTSGWQLNTELFFSNFPLFWLPYFVAGLLLSRLFNEAKDTKPTFLSIGDLAIVIIVLVMLIPDINPVLKYFLRFGALMPLYMLVILDLAHNKGLFARFMRVNFLKKLGDISFSIFIWQALVLALAFISIKHYPAIADYQVGLAIALILVISFISTHFIEKRISSMIRKKSRLN